ncbi:ABC transporter ATP-binding protein [Candidatus Saccharibacteria bacterium]|nr:ABC transporter ATP-binding protein [Candidatus Saccharibacteria bacterium]
MSVRSKKNSLKKSEIALEVKNVSKSFKLPIEQASGIKQAFLNWTKGIKGYKKQEVLKDISFKVEKGDFFGIVGRNGSGKSTLLKLISQIYEPDSGKIKVNGKLVPFIELGVGFNPELTGRENVYLNGALLGFSHEEVSKMYEEIVEFAELEEFMDQKLKNYSSGMQVRLAFSIAIKAQGDILVLDEVLAVGDSAFQQKCFNYFAKLKNDKKTVILVSHSMAQIQRFCNRAVLIEKGEIIEDDTVSSVTSKYENLFIDDINNIDNEGRNLNTVLTPNLTVEVNTKQDGANKKVIIAKKVFDIIINVSTAKMIKALNVGISVRDSFDNIVLSTGTRNLNQDQASPLDKGESIEYSFSIPCYYTNGNYEIDIVVVDELSDESNKVLMNRNNIASFQVKGVKDYAHSMFHPEIILNSRKYGDDRKN